MRSLIVLLVVCSSLGATDPVTVAPPIVPPIRLPGLPAVPVPMPPVAPAPVPVTKITADRLYVIDSDVALIVLGSPPGSIVATTEPGPLKIRARFADGTGKIETRLFKGKFVTTAEAGVTGRAELIVIPSGVTEERQVIRQTVDVDAGEGAQPPPDGPVPAGLYFMVIRPAGPALPEFQRVMSDPAWGDLLKAGHLVKDFAQPDAARLGATIPTGVTLPAVVTLSVSADGKRSVVVRQAIALPTTADGIRKLPEVK